MTREHNDLTIAYMAGYHKAKGECKDDFQSRICENCKHWTREHFELGVCNEGVDTEHIMDIAEGVTKVSFGCTVFERKKV